MPRSFPTFPDGPDPTGDPELLLELAAWADGTLPPDRLAALEARLAEDPRARALAVSVRLEPVTSETAAAPVPAAVVARAAGLVGAAEVEAADVEGLDVEAARTAAAAGRDRAEPEITVLRGPWRGGALFRGAVAAAACLAAVVAGWRLGGLASRPGPAAGETLAARGGGGPANAGDPSTTSPADEDELLAVASFGVFGDDDEGPLEFLMLVDADEGVVQ